MKKKEINLNLNKRIIANINLSQIRGGNTTSAICNNSDLCTDVSVKDKDCQSVNTLTRNTTKPGTHQDFTTG